MKNIFLCLFVLVFGSANCADISPDSNTSRSFEEIKGISVFTSDVGEQKKKIDSPVSFLSLLQDYVSEFLSFFKNSPKNEFMLSQWITASLQLSSMTPDELDRNWCLKDYFGHIKIIGNEGSSRYPQLIEELAKVGLSIDDIEMSSPVIGADLPRDLWSRVPDWAGDTPEKKQGVTGCTMAHYYLIKDTNERYLSASARLKRLKKDVQATREEVAEAEDEMRRYSSVLIMEDNNAFGRLDFQGLPYLEGMGQEFRLVMQQLPEKWDMFYFLCLHGPWGPTKEVKDRPLLLQSTYGTSTKCYALNAKSYAKIVKKFEDILTGTGEVPPVDHIIASIHKKTYTYMPKLPLAYRYASQSLVGGGGDVDSHWQTNPY